MKSTTIELNKAEHAHIRQYLSAMRRGDGYSADAGETVVAILRRVGFSSADTVFPMHQRTKGICVVCGCTERDACPPGCSWEPGHGKTICDHCAEA